ncbi:uncharacterized protein TNIN_158681 [Trichonephila inaurata madagascariensis]|uniref:HSF-type DNA-binding domain-containing protein n=1 Tax=Trichonephila inaurata madagascariensis TaxID=2747483 RepID=A0A8X6XZV0_9ARAC|nr:uncharacterized protein TNIN_158681 [Trichonephila inaurata madagascariensis]
MKFPEILWSIVNDERINAVKWNLTGDKICVNYDLLRNEILNNNGIFKTNSISSFVRQLNLYGFRKCKGYRAYSKTINRYENPLFIKGRKDLLDKMKRQIGTNSRRRRSKTRTNKYSKRRNFDQGQESKSKSVKMNYKEEKPSEVLKEITNKPLLNHYQDSNAMFQAQNLWWNNTPNSLSNILSCSGENAHSQDWLSMQSNFYNPFEYMDFSMLPQDLQMNENLCDADMTIDSKLRILENYRRYGYFFLMPDYISYMNSIMCHDMPFYPGAMPFHNVPMKLEPEDLNLSYENHDEIFPDQVK